MIEYLLTHIKPFRIKTDGCPYEDYSNRFASSHFAIQVLAVFVPVFQISTSQWLALQLSSSDLNPWSAFDSSSRASTALNLVWWVRDHARFWFHWKYGFQWWLKSTDEQIEWGSAPSLLNLSLDVQFDDCWRTLEGRASTGPALRNLFKLKVYSSFLIGTYLHVIIKLSRSSSSYFEPRRNWNSSW